jgi:hypothetical protein
MRRPSAPSLPRILLHRVKAKDAPPELRIPEFLFRFVRIISKRLSKLNIKFHRSLSTLCVQSASFAEIPIAASITPDLRVDTTLSPSSTGRRESHAGLGVMALQAAYQQFLASPNTSFLDNDASLHYVTTTTSFTGSSEIIKHLSTQRNQIKKKKEEFLSIVEGANAIAAEVETNLEFMSSGGVYLPALDDNFVADHTVYLPIVSRLGTCPLRVMSCAYDCTG